MFRRFSVNRNMKKLVNANDKQRCQAASVLGKLRDERAVSHLIRALEDSSVSVQQAAIEALAELAAVEALPAIAEAFSSPNKEVRTCVVRALPKFRDANAVEPFLTALGDPDSDVRSEAISEFPTLVQAVGIDTIDRTLIGQQVRWRLVRWRLGNRIVSNGLCALARFCRDNKDIEKALCWAKKAVDLYPSHRGSLALLTSLYIRQGQIDDAMAMGLRLLDVGPRHRSLSSLVKTLIGRGRIDDAETIALKLLDKDPSNSKFMDAWISVREKQSKRDIGPLFEDKCRAIYARLKEVENEQFMSTDLFSTDGTARLLDVLGERPLVPTNPLAAAMGAMQRLENAKHTVDDYAHEAHEKARRQVGAQYQITEGLLTAIEREGERRSWLRESAGELLGELGDVELLAEQLGHEDINVRHAAMLGLAKLGDTRALSPLVKALTHRDDWAVREKAADALGKLGDNRAVDALINILREDYTELCCEAAKSLGELGDKRAVQPLIARLQEVRHSYKESTGQEAYRESMVREEAALALGKLGDERALEPLLEALKDTALHGERVAFALGAMGDKRAVPALIEAAKNDHSVSWVTGRFAVMALARLGDQRAVEPLIEMLEKGTGMRWNIARALGELKDKRAIEPLWRVLQDDEDEEHRDEAASALANLGDARVFKTLVAELRNEHSEHPHRAKMAVALGRLGDKRAVDSLLEALQNERPGDRGEVARALGGLGDKRAVHSLLDALHDEPLIDEEIVEALGMLGDERAVEPLIAVLEAKHDLGILAAAAEALGMLGDARAVGPLTTAAAHKWKEVRDAAVGALRTLEPSRD